MRSERIASLSRYVMVDALNPAITASVQWFERTLDDSANKRISVAESFLATDGILDLCSNVTSALVVYPKVIEKRLRSELPFMLTENIMMEAVKRGGDRQELHEIIRKLSMEASEAIKDRGEDNPLLERIAQTKEFGVSIEELDAMFDPALYVGLAPKQVENFLRETITPLLQANVCLIGEGAQIFV
jgi:adenylosuccinate lyase